MPGRNYEDHQYRKRQRALRNLVRTKGLPCWLCGRPIDLDLPPRHAMAFTADHVNAIANGGRLLGDLQPAHRACNSRRGRKRTEDQIPRPKTTRDW